MACIPSAGEFTATPRFLTLVKEKPWHWNGPPSAASIPSKFWRLHTSPHSWSVLIFMMKFAFVDPVFFWLADLTTAENTEFACRIKVGSSVAELHKGAELETGDGGSAKVVPAVAKVVVSSSVAIDSFLGAGAEATSRNAMRGSSATTAGGPTTLVGFEEGRESPWSSPSSSEAVFSSDSSRPA